MLIDNTLTWEVHVNAVVRKVFAGMHQIKRLRRFLPVGVRRTLVQALILPHLDYCSVVYNGLSGELNNKLQRALNYSLRFIFDARWNDHVTPLYRELVWLKLEQRRLYCILCQTYKLIVKGAGPEYLREKLVLFSEIHARDTRSHCYFLQIPQHRSAIFGASFCVTASREWNALPLEIILTPSLSLFRRRVHRRLILMAGYGER